MLVKNENIMSHNSKGNIGGIATTSSIFISLVFQEKFYTHGRHGGAATRVEENDIFVSTTEGINTLYLSFINFYFYS